MERAWGRWGWGFIDQGFSSVSNFGLTILAARLLGPRGLGIVAIGFALYLVALGFQQTLISQPLVISTSTLAPSERSWATGCSVTATIVLALTVALVLTGFGWMVGGAVGKGLVIIAPWIVPALLQDHWRAILFREGRGPAAASNDAVWIIGMVLFLPLAWSVGTGWAVVGCWGFGAALAAALGLAQVRAPWVDPASAWRWWRNDAWPMGRWLAGEGAIYMIGGQAILFAMVALVGTAAIGGYRAAMTIFGPLTLLRPAVALPGLPAMTRAVSSSTRKARLLAAKLSGGLVVVTMLYLLSLDTHRTQFLVFVFGASFARYGGLIVPIGVEQIFDAITIGFSLLLKARRRGGGILWSQAVGQTSTLVLASGLALRYGITGAAWGMAAAGALECTSVMWFSLSHAGRPAGSGGREVAAPGVGARSDSL
jgi:O-antigen/teichoic acid export membrane protein